jgi:hypothetical protein
VATYYPLTLKVFIRGISAFCQLNHISINVEQLVKQYLPSFIYSQQFSFAFQSKPSQYSDLPNGQLTQATDIYGLVSTYILKSEDNCIQEGITATNNALITIPSHSYAALNRMQQLTGIE